MSKIEKKIAIATKWSAFGEIFAKITSPIVNMVLARLLTPEAFGVVAAITIITSFADIFTDAGFQRYIIQHEYKNDRDLDDASNVAFWTNFVLSVTIFFIIFSFRKNLAKYIGCPDAYNALVVAALSIICTSLSSTKLARFRKILDFKPVFITRCISAMIPLFITVPLAFLMKSYWALVLGTVFQQISIALILSLKSSWKIKFYYRFSVFKEMLAFSVWNLLESLSFWFAGQASVFIVGNVLSTYHLGLYRTSMSTVNSCMAIITASITPVLYSALSKVQNNQEKYEELLLQFQLIIAIILFPIGMGVMIFRELAVNILLGSQWMDAADFLGMWAVSSAIMIVFSNTACEVYRSKGKPQLSLFLQILNLIIYIPAIYLSANKGFETLCLVSCWIRGVALVMDFMALQFIFKIRFISIIRNIVPVLGATTIMSLVAIILKTLVRDNLLNNFVVIGVCVCIYFGQILCYPKYRMLILEFVPKKKGE